ncbi:alpha/beta fold hydrolase [Halarchaeum acidiphilum]|uniref:alpha/beta fold hydrolase n=1 Tax=Halarchaeum acidiphilum TaxID=489138 RepID=UPI00131F254A|nr:alpha/beta fold hydrolase [Halarchaeum acidiphilum]
MTTFVLLHGAYHGAWCWYRVRDALESRGHAVVTFDLPAHGIDTTPPGSVTLDDYVDAACAAIDRAADETVLVGHSMSGVVAAGAAERRPDALDATVYLTAYLPTDGDSMLDLRAPDTALDGNFVVDEDRGLGTVREGALDDVFYGDCPPEERALAHSLVRAEPMAPLSSGIPLTDANFGRVPRAYVECTADATIPIAHQRAMREATPVERVVTLDASHSPFLSLPVETADALERAAAI